MAFDEDLADRVRVMLGRLGCAAEEKRMFGGLAFLVDGRMRCGVLNGDLVVKLSRDQVAQALTEPHTREMDFTGRPMKSFLYVGPGGTASDTDLHGWLARALAVAAGAPPGTPAHSDGANGGLGRGSSRR